MKLKKIIITIILAAISTTFMLGCEPKKETKQKNYDGRVFYEVFVRAFNDSDGDGIGDLKGVTEKLDYLEELGINGIWLMPITEASSYHGYDTDDYYSIEKDYGTMDDFKELLKEAKKRDIKVIMDLVLNHTSINNKWFVSAKEGEDSEFRDYYVWTKDMSKKNDVSAMDTKEWTQNGDKEELYYSIFWSGMPDLNYENPKVVKEAKKIAKYYLDIGVDGFRLDGAKWITNDTDKNVQFWDDFNKYCKSINKDAITVGEVWDSAYNTVNYTSCFDSFFEFSMGEYIVDRINGGSISGFPDDYNNINEIYKDENKDFVMAPFLTNHDLSRVMCSLNDEYKMKVAAVSYLTLPGTPFIYYGEEIGMKGSGADENVREPFIWSDSDDSLNSSWRISTQDKSKVAVNIQEDDKDSLLNFYKDILKIRNSYSVLRYGNVGTGDSESGNSLVMKRTYEDECAYVIANDNNEKDKIKLEKGKYKVVYSNKGRKDDIKVDKSLEIGEEEILILIKK